MFNWRAIPTPYYGNWGGAGNTCHESNDLNTPDGCPLPVDKMDGNFRGHDATLDDWALAVSTAKTNPLKLKGKVWFMVGKKKIVWDNPVARTAYWASVVAIFGTVGGIKHIFGGDKK